MTQAKGEAAIRSKLDTAKYEMTLLAATMQPSTFTDLFLLAMQEAYAGDSRIEESLYHHGRGRSATLRAEQESSEHDPIEREVLLGIRERGSQGIKTGEPT